MNLLLAIATLVITLLVFVSIFVVPSRYQPRVGRSEYCRSDDLNEYKPVIRSVNIGQLSRALGSPAASNEERKEG